MVRAVVLVVRCGEIVVLKDSGAWDLLRPLGGDGGSRLSRPHGRQDRATGWATVLYVLQIAFEWLGASAGGGAGMRNRHANWLN